jgi:hypothetical protein
MSTFQIPHLFLFVGSEYIRRWQTALVSPYQPAIIWNVPKKMPPVRIQGASTIACHMKTLIWYRLFVQQAILTGK